MQALVLNNVSKSFGGIDAVNLRIAEQYARMEREAFNQRAGIEAYGEKQMIGLAKQLAQPVLDEDAVRRLLRVGIQRAENENLHDTKACTGSGVRTGRRRRRGGPARCTAGNDRPLRVYRPLRPLS